MTWSAVAAGLIETAAASKRAAEDLNDAVKALSDSIVKSISENRNFVTGLSRLHEELDVAKVVEDGLAIFGNMVELLSYMRQRRITSMAEYVRTMPKILRSYTQLFSQTQS